MKKLALLVTALVISGGIFVAGPFHKAAVVNPPHNYGVPQEVTGHATPDSTPTTEPATTPVTSDPAPIEQPTPYPLLDFSVNHIGFSDTAGFTPPSGSGFNWQVNVSFTPLEGQGPQALLFVMNADTDCGQTPPDRFGCGVINLVDVDSHDQPITFSFPEQGMDNKVYLKLAAGNWHVTVTAYDKPLYPVIRAETLSDFYGATN